MRHAAAHDNYKKQIRSNMEHFKQITFEKKNL